jgi:hypothetical protein
VQDVVFSYRCNHFSYDEAMKDLIRVEQDLVNMVQFNWFLNSIIAEVEEA